MKNKLFSLNIIFTLLFLIMSALFLIYIFRELQNRECFEEYSWKYGEGHSCSGDLNTNTELRKRNSEFRSTYNRFDNNSLYTRTNIRNSSHPYRKYCDVMNFNDLLAYRCLQKSPVEMSGLFRNLNIANTLDYVYIYDEKSMYSHILKKIQSQKGLIDNDAKIIGPVYVCISQAPYLKYNSEYSNNNNKPFTRMLDARIDILNNRNPYYLEKISKTGVQSFVTNTSDGSTDESIISSLYSHILIVYPLYTITNNKMVLKSTNKAAQADLVKNFLDNTMKPYYTENELCFIKCNKSSTLNCGCLTRTERMASTQDAGFFTYNNENYPKDDNRDLPLYTSKCIDHTSSSGSGANFSMMYYVNPYSDSYGDGNIIEDPEPMAPLPAISPPEPLNPIPIFQLSSYMISTETSTPTASGGY